MLNRLVRALAAVDDAAPRVVRPALAGLVAGVGATVGSRGPALGPAAVTPSAAFGDVPDWPYETRYVEVRPGGYRMAYVDEGPRDGPVVWLQHGNPTWGVYWRAAVPALVDAGFRVVVPDLVGFGRSDKPLSRSAHTYAHHEAWLLSLVEALDLRDVNAHLHDWGGLLGLRLVAFHRERFARVLVSNTALPLGDAADVPSLFRLWQLGAQVLPAFGPVVAQQSAARLDRAVVAAYDAPWPTRAVSLAPRQLPLEVPLRPGPAARRNRDALAALGRFDRPFLTAYSDPDGITPGAAELFESVVPGARGQPHRRYPGTLHYLMEDVPAELTALMVEFFRG